eukprot:TRINITY_DN8648_c0_g1_i3.p1 TRINITY_DN8648_c0_g1~~TRINITY_DN8648_c0_g1_i3.p1  ORF type:complete len:253 (-),score=33.30 TRINITY_DN8648_c0_g1_i3:65-823(-)
MSVKVVASIIVCYIVVMCSSLPVKRVEVYFAALDEESRELIGSNLDKFIHAVLLSKDWFLEDQLELILHPSGGMSHDLQPDDYIALTCLNGDDECFAHRILSCAMTLEHRLKGLHFVTCFERHIGKKGDDDVAKITKHCANEHGFDYDDLMLCAWSERGELLLRKEVLAHPGQTAVPLQIIVDRQHDIDAEDKIKYSLLRWICEELKYHEGACSATMLNKYGKSEQQRTTIFVIHSLNFLVYVHTVNVSIHQ